MSVPTVSGGILPDIVTWVRRIIKSPSSQTISSTAIIDYINRFYTYDVPERVQLFELKRQYTFETVPNIFEYQFPYKNYQLIETPAYCDGVQLGFYTSNDAFYSTFPELVLNEDSGEGDGGNGPYSFDLGQNPILRGFTDDLGNLEPYVFITALNASLNQIYVVDNGLGQLIQTDATFQKDASGTTTPPIVGTVNYLTGEVEFELATDTVPDGNIIASQCSPYSAGFPRIALFFNNIIKLYPVPQRAYKIQFDAYITPAQFLTTTASVPFAYMSEYLARGAARKILTDNADMEQFQFYEPLFKEQENLVLRRTNRINSINRISTIFSQQTNQTPWMYYQQ